MALVTVNAHQVEVVVDNVKLEPHEVDIVVDVETGDLKPADAELLRTRVHEQVRVQLLAAAHDGAEYGAPFFLSNGNIPPMKSLSADAVLAEMKRAQEEWLERIQTRQQALVNLWKYAASQVRVRHPDPKVDVRVDVHSYGIADDVRLEFIMFNLCDTSYDNSPGQEHRMWRFRHGVTIMEWPGLENAKMLISAAWALYMQHEAFELVTLRDRAGCEYHDGHVEGCPECAGNAAIIDAHGATHHQKLLRETGHVKQTLQWALGDSWAQALLDADAARAKQDLDNEIAWVKEPWDVCC